MKYCKSFLSLVSLILITVLCYGHGDREIAEDQEAVKTTGFWVYNDLDAGFAEAKKTGKPMLVVFR